MKRMATLVGMMAAAVGLSACDSESRLWASEVEWQTSPGGRVDVAFTVTNEGEDADNPDCHIVAEDIDGFEVDSDSLIDTEDIAPGDSQRIAVTTTIDAYGVHTIGIEEC